MPRLSQENVKIGVCLSVAHALRLIEDASILYVTERIASSFHLAVMAREELGRALLLWKQASAMKDADTVDVQDLARQIQHHVAKLDAGQSTTHVELPSGLMAAWTAAIEKNDRMALVEIHKQRTALFAKVRKHDPSLLHKRRLKAQYVDLNGDGSWSKPSDTK